MTCLNFFTFDTVICWAESAIAQKYNPDISFNETQGISPSRNDLNAIVFRNPSAGTELINIRFFVSAPEEIVSLKVFDLKGALLWHEENQYANTGTQTVQWDGKNSGGTPTGKGVYFMKIMNGSNVSLIKIMRE